MFWILYLGSQGILGHVATTRATGEADAARDGQGATLVVSPVGPEAASVGQLAYQALREAILAMDIYRPGADLRLDEQRLAEALGVSRTPVRQALARLDHEGLVRIMPRRGVLIVRKSKAEITEMIRAWAALESMAARLVCERATDEEIRELRDLFAGFEGDELRLHLDEYSEANLVFHSRIIELGRSPVITNMVDGLLVHVRAIRGRMIGQSDRAERSIVDHMHIIEALESRDAELAERLVRDHALDLAADVERFDLEGDD
jgi:DNA-binding GntR family transcriptional regulator